MRNKTGSKALCNRAHGHLDKCGQSSITDLQHELFNEGVVSRKLLDAVPNPLLIINDNCQVVYANPAVRKMFDNDGEAPVTGLSEGEAFHCVHARHSVVEAGKHECCRICGDASFTSTKKDGTTFSLVLQSKQECGRDS